MPVSGNEIATLDFNNLIGGPLNAIVQAQAKSAITTANFIREVGFDENGRARNVDFKYNKRNEDGADKEFRLTVPFLTMLPIPYMVIERASLEFNARINSVNTQTVESTVGIETEATASADFWFVSASMSTNYSYQQKTVTSERAERTFEMSVMVEAGAAEIPSGTDRLLTLLENTIKENKGLPVYKVRVRSGSAGAYVTDEATGLEVTPPTAVTFVYGGTIRTATYGEVTGSGGGQAFGISSVDPVIEPAMPVGTALELKRQEAGGTPAPVTP
ncbi:MAG: DUF2589 domain-containing protein [Deltaproteobacteria bacterium]|nr:DUF2589 domain-containing protein [Deltaproteobacteria bacterium]